ncbi:MAG: restriction endonuclease [Bdellovibrionales bacterium RIFOXYB1_FULL_37_110]|nr:MAG: restriction endonuclease [Bdellovibrionales bacterium RIFOXYC1_FULL_37_79]OFZ57381.1 MAG: restriction endonuclease [Bdellovibrionales bacterium RIFOXYB1_FULL_37_110]OFZ63800.1 MAG: restriction endonuclease [Bdellovibrionales bacterium RIFOXYD1_FULL_36_51]
MNYKKEVERLLQSSPFPINLNITLTGRTPSLASSEFLTNKEQGDWAEQVVLKAINDNNFDYVAVQYGRSDTLSAGDDGFKEFYDGYLIELNTIGKKPDILIFRRTFFESKNFDLISDNTVSKAVAALEVRSSSFLANKYDSYMKNRAQEAITNCIRLRDEIVNSPLGELLKSKSESIFELLHTAKENSFCDLDFRLTTWSSSQDLKSLSQKLKELKENIKVLHKRDYLSITPKLEDLALVNRWIQKYGVKHYYLQVFFDMAYVIPFKSILEITSNPENEGKFFSVESDVKNQGKSTIKVNVHFGKKILRRIDMPTRNSTMKELSRGRLLFYVTFTGGKGYLDKNIFINEVVGGK